MTPEQLVAQTATGIGSVGGAYYFHPDSNARAEELGIHPVALYFLGRGGVLGTPDPAVVLSAFGYFNIDAVRKWWERGVAVMTPAEAVTVAMECAHSLGRKMLSSCDGLEEFCEAAEIVVDSCPVDGLPLFAGFAALQRPEDAPARAYHLVVVLREMRGGLHLAAINALGVPALVAHAHRRPTDLRAFGWPDDLAPEITDAQRAAIDEADRLTNDRHAERLAVLDPASATAYAAGVATIADAFAAG